MKRVNINLNSVDKVKSFIHVATALDCDLDLSSGRRMIDGKSIMGIFSLNIKKPIVMHINAKHNLEHILKEFEEFIIGEEL